MMGKLGGQLGGGGMLGGRGDQANTIQSQVAARRAALGIDASADDYPELERDWASPAGRSMPQTGSDGMITSRQPPRSGFRSLGR
jgi:hypothetical protein